MGPETGRWDTSYHAPVLVNEVLALLSGARTVLDCTLGGGGHSAALLEHGAAVTAIDRDEAAIEEARKRLATHDGSGRFRLFRANFAEVGALPELRDQSFDGILADLGVSSRQIDETARGFSFRPGALLDMRMDRRSQATAADLLNTLDEDGVSHIFRAYGDEPRATRLAREILRRRQTRPFGTSDDLVGAIRGALGARTGPGDFARLFQALRIAVNDELSSLERALPDLRDRLNAGGALVIISYHSGEDRLVKHTMREWSRSCVCPPKQPRCSCRGSALGAVLTKRAITPDAAETRDNPRARSARLRAWRRAA